MCGITGILCQCNNQGHTQWEGVWDGGLCGIDVLLLCLQVSLAGVHGFGEVFSDKLGGEARPHKENERKLMG